MSQFLYNVKYDLLANKLLPSIIFAGPPQPGMLGKDELLAQGFVGLYLNYLKIQHLNDEQKEDIINKFKQKYYMNFLLYN